MSIHPAGSVPVGSNRLVPGLGSFIGNTADIPTFALTAVGTAAWAACSLRKLRAGYTGAAIRVVRSSDSAELDIGFLGNGLNIPALMNHVGSGTGYVKKMYDQSGNGRDFVQSGAVGVMPQIVIAGTLQTVNGLPAIYYDLTNGKGLTYDATANTTFQDSVVAGVVRFASDGGNNARILAGRNSGDANDYDASSAIFAYRPGTNQQIASYNNAQQSTSSYTYSTLSTIRTVTDSGKGTVVLAVDGTEASGATSNNPSLRYFCTGDVLGFGSPLKGYINEFILWNSVLTSTQLSALQANQKAYWGTP